MAPQPSPRAWARRTTAALTWLGYSADAVASAAYLNGSMHWSAAAKLIGAGAKAGARVSQRWATRPPRPDN